MSKSPSERRLIENEVILRKHNEAAKKAVKEDFSPEKQKNLVLHFYCECSDLSCKERILISVHQYDQIHRQRDQFIIKIGHEVPKVESVVEKTKKFLIVEKYALQP